MESSKVFFTNLRTSPQTNLLDKLEQLIKQAGLMKLDFNKKFVALKIHFGEPGNLSYIRPNYIARLSKILYKAGAKPFLTDSNTLYSGGRSNAIDHIQNAMENGYNPISAQCPVIIADGLKGTDYREIPLNGKYCKIPKVGAAIVDADVIISVNHFKGHEQTGFGGALKNIGMGSASVGGKLELHSCSKPVIEIENCTGCNTCVRHCAYNAVRLNTAKNAEIDYEKCVGCGQCIAVCQYESAVLEDWDQSGILNSKIAEYTKAILRGKPNFHINFIMNVSPDCDCWGNNDAAIVPDIGMAASFDPVALDCACAYLVMKAPPLPESRLMDKCKGHIDARDDKFLIVHPKSNWKSGFAYAEEIGVGTQQYELINV